MKHAYDAKINSFHNGIIDKSINAVSAYLCILKQKIISLDFFCSNTLKAYIYIRHYFPWISFHNKWSPWLMNCESPNKFINLCSLGLCPQGIILFQTMGLCHYFNGWESVTLYFSAHLPLPLVYLSSSLRISIRALSLYLLCHAACL